MEINEDICKESVFKKVYNNLNKEVWRFIYYKCGNQEQANDLVQEAFIKLWQNCSKTTPAKVKSYLYTITNNAFLNEIAHKKVVLKHVKGQTISVNSESPQFVLEEKEFKIKVENAIANLTEGQRTAFLLNRIEGKKYAEIAEMLSISVKAVEKRMSQALASLRNEIDNFKV
ncbi:RNA polymerase sigma factor [Ulvibacter antarcticus]|uniref:RNA polymerase sigma-70 factor (ECF subfamily) n=1 Tax=Ulvibacter antarcticus TaxID=442714 RepID=A0A3L9Y8P3_9FLAO|nr:RNA polymerase sigma factor [Ulvibacter antarcticus]RMA57053.1 RNA polymerase sigma-70 factor (ECF subfamily) [Ulvibacter antarcticus]